MGSRWLQTTVVCIRGAMKEPESESGKTASEPGILLGGTRSISVSENLDLSVRKLGLQEAA